jgi:hypothetical protein
MAMTAKSIDRMIDIVSVLPRLRWKALLRFSACHRRALPTT